MDERREQRLRQLLTESRAELQGVAGECARALTQLEALDRALQASGLNKEVLLATDRALLAFPVLRPLEAGVRAVAPTNDGLNATRALLAEIRNRIVTFSRVQRS